MSFDCKGKVALITGASSGIGREIALTFGRAGAKVALVARNIDTLDLTKQKILEEDGFTEAFPCDLNRLSEIPRLVKEIEQHFGDPVSLLINNAGAVVRGTVDDVPVEAFLENITINFLAPVALVKEVVPKMKKRRCGQIINISSGCGWRGLPGVAAYSASKYALNGFTESLRVELAPSGIDVLLFSPGRVDTGIERRGIWYGEVKQSDAGSSQSAEAVAEKLLDASKKSKREVILSARTKIAVHLDYWFPRLLDFLLIRSKKKECRSSRKRG